LEPGAKLVLSLVWAEASWHKWLKLKVYIMAE
jgi:hypothetical protein